jgi:hypothetical protein
MMWDSYTPAYHQLFPSLDDFLGHIGDLGPVCVAGLLDPVVGSDVNTDKLPVYYDPRDPHSVDLLSHIRNGDLVLGGMDQETWNEWLE